MFLLANDVRAVLWFAVVPAVLSVAVLVFFVKEKRGAVVKADSVSFHSMGTLSARYWTIVALGGVLTLARFSEAFLILRGQELGLALALLPLALIAMNLAYTAIAYPAGVALDR